jgi:ribosomal protein S18 acetylase RimI-like enzyme
VLIVDLALIASWRGRGIGARLANGVLDEARAAGLPVRLSVFANNAAALRFYLRLGFKPVESSGFSLRLEWRDQSHLEARLR